MKVVATLCLLISAAAASSIAVLNANNLRSEIVSHPLSLVLYEAPWSPQSIEGRPVLEQLAGERKDLFVGSLDCETKETNEVCNKEKVEAYPTVRLYREGKESVDFGDDITKENLERFLSDPDAYPKLVAEKDSKEDEQKDPAMELNAQRLDLNQFQATIDVNQNLFILYYAPWCPRSIEMINQLKKHERFFNEKGFRLFTCNCDFQSHREICRGKMSHLPHVEVFWNTKFLFNSEKLFGEISNMDEKDLLKIFDEINKRTGSSEKTEQRQEEVENGDDEEDDDEPEPAKKTKDEL